MKLVRSKPLPSGIIGLVALLNVILLLLFFYVLGSSFVLQPGIAVTLPSSEFNLPPQSNARIITVQPGPPVRIFYQDQPVTSAELDRQLAAYQGSPKALILRADKGTPYESVVAVMEHALRLHYSVALAAAPQPDTP